MDPKNATLDPKLKEAYDRVMGTIVPSAVPKPSEPAQPVQPNPPPTSPQPMSVIEKAEKTLEKAKDNSEMVYVQNSPPAGDKKNIESPKTVGTFIAQAPQEKKSVFPLVTIVIIGVIVLSAYAFFWLSFFTIKLPFLP